MSVPAVLNALFQIPDFFAAKSNAQDYATVQQDLQSSAVSGGHHHRHYHSSGSNTSSASQNSLEQLFSQLGQALQSGNLSTAQSAYSSLQQEFAPLGSAVTNSAALSSSASSNVLNVTI